MFNFIFDKVFTVDGFDADIDNVGNAGRRVGWSDANNVNDTTAQRSRNW